MRRPISCLKLLPLVCLILPHDVLAQAKSTHPSTATSNQTIDVDPCIFASAEDLADIVSTGLEEALPLTAGSPGNRVTISNPRLLSATCPNLKVSVRVTVRYKKTRGFPQYSTSGSARVEARVLARVTLSNGVPSHAVVCLTDINVTGLNLSRIPNWLDNGWIRDLLNREIANEECFDVTDMVRRYVQQGGRLK